jgi:hypothetical protein
VVSEPVHHQDRVSSSFFFSSLFFEVRYISMIQLWDSDGQSKQPWFCRPSSSMNNFKSARDPPPPPLSPITPQPPHATRNASRKACALEHVHERSNLPLARRFEGMFLQFPFLGNGLAAVDIFFVLTGFLLAQPLLLPNARLHIVSFIWVRKDRECARCRTLR